MKSDRALLEAAARVMGYQNMLRWDDKFGCLTDHEGWVFDPLTDDGDSARLESAARLDVEWQEQHVIVGRTCLDKWQEPYSPHNGDRQKARRYAGLRAAAAIGEGMK